MKRSLHIKQKSEMAFFPPPHFSHTYIYKEKKVRERFSVQYIYWTFFIYTYQWLTQHLLEIHVLKFVSVSEIQLCTTFLEYNHLQGCFLVVSSGLCRDSNGFWNLLCIQTRCIFTFFFLFTCNRRSTKFCTSVNPAKLNMFHTSSIFFIWRIIAIKKKKVNCRM